MTDQSNEDLRELPGLVRAELTRLRAERVVFTNERERLHAQLREADVALRHVMAERDELAATHTAVEERLAAERARAELAEHAAALEADLATARGERDALRGELTDVRTERDELRLRLLDAELTLAGATSLVEWAQPAPNGRGAAVAEARAAALADELAATRATVSWRVTAPLRAVRRRTRKR